MIDLLPSSIKTSRAFGRKNGRLLRLNAALLLAVFGILVIGATGYFFINYATVSATETKKRAEELIASTELDKASKEYKAFSNNLKTVVQILNNQILFSKLLQQIGGVTPIGATLNSISLSGSDSALDLDFSTTSSNIAPTIQVNLEDPQNQLFEKADIVQVNCTTDSDGSEDCNVQLRALFKKDAKFLFLNSVEETEDKKND